jgi:hypothetical protein
MTHTTKSYLVIGLIILAVVALVGGAYWYVQNQQNLQSSSKGVINSDNLNKINAAGNPTSAAANASK